MQEGLYVTSIGLKRVYNVLGIYRVKGENMKIPLTKHDIPLTKYDVPLPFNNINSTVQHFIPCEDPLCITGSPAKRQGYPLRQYIPHGKRAYEILFLSC